MKWLYTHVCKEIFFSNEEKISIENIKRLRKQIKERSNKQNIKEFLESLGYRVDKNYMFSIRSDENTPSSSIRKYGYIKDFGSGWSGDIVALLHEHHGVRLSKAVKQVAKFLGIGEEEL